MSSLIHSKLPLIRLLNSEVHSPEKNITRCITLKKFKGCQCM